MQYLSYLLSKCQITCFSPVPSMVEDALEAFLLLMYPWYNIDVSLIYIYIFISYIYIHIYIYIYIYIFETLLKQIL